MDKELEPDYWKGLTGGRTGTVTETKEQTVHFTGYIPYE